MTNKNNPVGRPKGSFQYEEAKVHRTHYMTPKAHAWILGHKHWIEETTRAGDTPEITWNNFHRHVILNAGEQDRLERTVRTSTDPLADMVAHILASPHCFGE